MSCPCAPWHGCGFAAGFAGLAPACPEHVEARSCLLKQGLRGKCAGM